VDVLRECSMDYCAMAYGINLQALAVRRARFAHGVRDFPPFAKCAKDGVHGDLGCNSNQNERNGRHTASFSNQVVWLAFVVSNPRGHFIRRMASPGSGMVFLDGTSVFIVGVGEGKVCSSHCQQRR